MSKRNREPLPPRLISLDQAATQLELSRTTIKKLVAEGKLRSVKIGPLRRIIVASLDEYLAQLERRQVP